MKKIETVKIPAKKAVAAKPATTKQVEKTVCDFCGADVPDHGSYGWYPSCHLCGRDCCREHNIADQDWTDYPDWYCQHCYHLKFTKYAERFDDIAREHEMAIESLEYIIREESLKL